MVKSALEAFMTHVDDIMEGIFDDDLVSVMELADLCLALKRTMSTAIQRSLIGSRQPGQ